MQTSFPGPRVAELIDSLQLAPHPEGGFFREIFRSAARVQLADDRESRAALTSIYYLLPRGTHSRWHRVRSDEVWHLYEGGPLRLHVVSDNYLVRESVVLGRASPSSGPSYTVPARWWQAATPEEGYALCGCTVGPGFEFADFAFARDDVAGEQLGKLGPEFRRLL